MFDYDSEIYPIKIAGYGHCRHWRQPVQVGRYTLTCSSFFSNPVHGVLLPPHPGFSIYLSVQWNDVLSHFWTNGSYLKVLGGWRPYPALVVDCKDMGTLSSSQLALLVNVCWNKMRQGKSVDIGCGAGHGRSGLLLSCLIARIEHLDGKTAIAEARRRYCSLAVENQVQERSVIEYARQYVKTTKRR